MYTAIFSLTSAIACVIATLVFGAKGDIFGFWLIAMIIGLAIDEDFKKKRAKAAES